MDGAAAQQRRRSGSARPARRARVPQPAPSPAGVAFGAHATCARPGLARAAVAARAAAVNGGGGGGGGRGVERDGVVERDARGRRGGSKPVSMAPVPDGPPAAARAPRIRDGHRNRRELLQGRGGAQHLPSTASDVERGSLLAALAPRHGWHAGEGDDGCGPAAGGAQVARRCLPPAAQRGHRRACVPQRRPLPRALHCAAPLRPRNAVRVHDDRVSAARPAAGLSQRQGTAAAPRQVPAVHAVLPKLHVHPRALRPQL